MTDLEEFRKWINSEDGIWWRDMLEYSNDSFPEFKDIRSPITISLARIWLDQNSKNITVEELLKEIK